ncbi:MAG: endo-1,4-beta-xylanase [Bacteroidales bacterium]|nr:endo-1,4-beta-xylanase [Bacteroidales bacterium]
MKSKSLINKINRKKYFFLIVLILGLFGFKSFSQTYPPSSVITLPHSNAYFKSGSDVVIKVFATDLGKSTNNGTVSKVEFYNGTTKLGEATTHTNNTYTYTWGCVPAGTYTLKATATNNKGVSFTSVGVIITVGTSNVTARGISANKGKYLANIIANSANVNYNTLWNGVTAENSCKWGSVEGTRNSMNWGGADVSYNHAKNNNMMFRYHAALWAAQYPSWLLNLSTADAKAETVEYMKAIAARYPLIDQIDVLNEQLGNHQADNQKFRDKFSGITNCPADNFSWQIWLFEQARAIFPNTKLILNDYGLENDQNAINMQLNLLKALRDRGIVDGFGTQAHCFNIDGLSASGLKSSLDKMAGAGVPIYVTELDLNGGSESNTNDAVQNTSYQSHFPVYWEHPAVAGITLWGYVTGATWIGGTGLMNSSGVEKPAMTWLKQYMSGKPNVSYPFGTITSNSCCSTPAPTVSATNLTYKKGATASVLSANGTSLKWYTVASGGTALGSAPTPSTATVGTTVYYVSQTANSCESQRASITVVVFQPQSPYNGTAAVIPGIVQFENYDEGGLDSAYSDSSPGSAVTPVVNFRTTEDVDIETCTDTDGGYNIGYAIAGEWLEYTVNVATAGKYNITIRAACNGDGRTISLQTNGVTIANNITIPNTTGWQIWQDVVVKDVNLSAGTQVIRLTIGATDYVNLNYMSFAPASVAPTVKLTSPAAGSEFNTSQTVTISATASSTTGTIVNVSFYANNILLSTDATAPYSFDWKGMTSGNYEITATATDNSGATASDKVTIKINAAPISIQLKKGWNLIGYPLDASADLAVALSSVWSNVLAVKDLESFYLKTNPTYLNTLIQLKWGQGYLISVDKDCSLIWNK